MKQRMLVVMPLILMPEQDVIRKAFIRDVIDKSEKYDIDFCIAIKKELKCYEEQGIIKALTDNNINILDVSNCSRMKGMSIEFNKSDYEEIARPYDVVYIIGMLHRSCKGLYQTAYNSICSSDDEVVVKHGYGSGLSMLKRILPILFVMSQSSPTVVQYCVDWMEFSLLELEQDNCKVIQYGHYANHNSHWYCTHYPMYEKYLRAQLGKRVDKSKPTKFIFGYTATDKSREALSKKVSEIEKEMSNAEIYARDSYRKVKNTIPQTQYLARLAKAKVSLIVPSYDRSEFSWMRFCECMVAECIPIVCIDDKVYDQYRQSMAKIFKRNGWEELYKFMDEYKLIVKFSELNAELILTYSEVYIDVMPQIKKLFNKVIKSSLQSMHSVI